MMEPASHVENVVLEYLLHLTVAVFHSVSSSFHILFCMWNRHSVLGSVGMETMQSLVAKLLESTQLIVLQSR